MTVIVRPEAATDIEHTYRWYERQGIGLGSRFLAALQIVFDSIAQVQANTKSFIGTHAERCSSAFPTLCFTESTEKPFWSWPACIADAIHVYGNRGESPNP